MNNLRKDWVNEMLKDHNRKVEAALKIYCEANSVSPEDVIHVIRYKGLEIQIEFMLKEDTIREDISY